MTFGKISTTYDYSVICTIPYMVAYLFKGIFDMNIQTFTRPSLLLRTVVAIIIVISAAAAIYNLTLSVMYLGEWIIRKLDLNETSVEALCMVSIFIISITGVLWTYILRNKEISVCVVGAFCIILILCILDMAPLGVGSIPLMTMALGFSILKFIDSL